MLADIGLAFVCLQLSGMAAAAGLASATGSRSSCTEWPRVGFSWCQERTFLTRPTETRLPGAFDISQVRFELPVNGSNGHALR